MLSLHSLLHRTYLTFCISVFCFALFQCKSAPKKKKTISNLPKTPYEMVQIRKDTCTGKCPVYEASFFSDGKMFYKGIDYVPLKGEHTYIVPEKLVKNMAVEAKKIKYLQFKDEYKTQSGVQLTRTKVVIDGKTKTIAAQNNEGTPEALRKFQQSLHDEVMTIIAEQEPFKEPKSK
jgi:hypothetical protein